MSDRLKETLIMFLLGVIASSLPPLFVSQKLLHSKPFKGGDYATIFSSIGNFIMIAVPLLCVLITLILLPMIRSIAIGLIPIFISPIITGLLLTWAIDYHRMALATGLPISDTTVTVDQYADLTTLAFNVQQMSLIFMVPVLLGVFLIFLLRSKRQSIVEPNDP